MTNVLGGVLGLGLFITHVVQETAQTLVVIFRVPILAAGMKEIVQREIIRVVMHVTRGQKQ